ncbi:MAG: hypothetical protein QNJ36_20210 [Calothrix sp. MO_167.B42]|nr:hypothetical protein [Calothrix sp. MO_167.B42]
MLKPLLSSGWFRVQSFLNYSVIMLLVAPLLVVSGSSSARQSTVAKNTPGEGFSDSLSEETNIAENISVEPEQLAIDSVAGEKITGDHTTVSSQALRKSHLQGENLAAPMTMAVVRPTSSIQADAIDSLVGEEQTDSSSQTSSQQEPLAVVEFSPVFTPPSSQLHEQQSQSQLVEKLRSHKTASLESKSVTATAVAPSKRKSLPQTQDMRVVEELDEAELEKQEDPIASPHPVPWKWITSTQKAIGSQGISGVRYYRSVPVISPDGRYAVYSRVQLQVEPEMHNTRVTSMLFIEDRQTRKLKVLKSSSQAQDPLLQAKATPASYVPHGTIDIFVPISWSKSGDRFLARKFQGLMNTSDARDSAVIWDREDNSTNTITPSQNPDEHHKISVLLGWSKVQPTQVMFRAGELGEEEWPLVTVADNGTTVAATDADQPVVFGDLNQDIWGGSQVAYR